MVRLTTDMWVSAYLNRLRLEAIPAYVMRKGDATAGAVIVKLSTLNGNAIAYERGFDWETGERNWRELMSGPECDVDASIEKQKGFDPDLWVIEVEDRDGRSLLFDEGF